MSDWRDEQHFWFEWFQNHVGPLEQWPYYIRNIFFKGHIKNNERFAMFCFLYGNGVYPPQIGNMMIKRWRFDKHAREDIQGIVRKALSGELQLKGVWSMNQQKWLD